MQKYAHTSGVMSALRILAHELQKSDTQNNANLSMYYCTAIEVLLDYVDDTILLYPAWGKYTFPSVFPFLR